jgi:hypothetical protein
MYGTSQSLVTAGKKFILVWSSFVALPADEEIVLYSLASDPMAISFSLLCELPDSDFCWLSTPLGSKLTNNSTSLGRQGFLNNTNIIGTTKPNVSPERSKKMKILIDLFVQYQVALSQSIFGVRHISYVYDTLKVLTIIVNGYSSSRYALEHSKVLTKGIFEPHVEKPSTPDNPIPNQPKVCHDFLPAMLAACIPNPTQHMVPRLRDHATVEYDLPPHIRNLCLSHRPRTHRNRTLLPLRLS